LLKVKNKSRTKADLYSTHIVRVPQIPYLVIWVSFQATYFHLYIVFISRFLYQHFTECKPNKAIL